MHEYPPIVNTPDPDLLDTPAKPPARTGAVTIRIRYSECDPMGVAHHGSYAAWLEIGRTELLRPTGISYADMERAGVYLVITRLELKYRRPIFYDDVVEVRTRVIGGSKVKIEHEYELAIIEDGGHRSHRSADGEITPRPLGEVVTTGATTLVCVGKDGRVRPLPDWLMQ
jgi:acyl-CoA thioester hydrolase